MSFREIAENIQKEPVQRNPKTKPKPAKIGKNQKLEPFLSHIYVLRNKHGEIALGLIANKGCCGIVEGGAGKTAGIKT